MADPCYENRNLDHIGLVARIYDELGDRRGN
jgi:hypothetical protein